MVALGMGDTARAATWSTVSAGKVATNIDLGRAFRSLRGGRVCAFGMDGRASTCAQPVRLRVAEAFPVYLGIALLQRPDVFRDFVRHDPDGWPHARFARTDRDAADRNCAPERAAFARATRRAAAAD